jgi:hypothetical protein
MKSVVRRVILIVAGHKRSTQTKKMGSIPDTATLRKALKVAELRECLEGAGLDTSGTKPVLLERLEEVSSRFPSLSFAAKKIGGSVGIHERPLPHWTKALTGGQCDATETRTGTLGSRDTLRGDPISHNRACEKKNPPQHPWAQSIPFLKPSLKSRANFQLFPPSLPTPPRPSPPLHVTLQYVARAAAGGDAPVAAEEPAAADPAPAAADPTPAAAPAPVKAEAAAGEADAAAAAAAAPAAVKDDEAAGIAVTIDRGGAGDGEAAAAVAEEARVAAKKAAAAEAAEDGGENKVLVAPLPLDINDVTLGQLVALAAPDATTLKVLRAPADKGGGSMVGAAQLLNPFHSLPHSA